MCASRSCGGSPCSSIRSFPCSPERSLSANARSRP